MAMRRRCSVRVDAEFGGCDPAARGFFHFETRAGIHAAQSVDQGLGRSSSVEQSTDSHVAADTGEGVEVTDFHQSICGRASAAGARQEKSTIPETGVSAGFTSTTLAPEALARCTSPAAG